MAAPTASLCRDITEMTKLDEGWIRKKLNKRRKRYRARLSKLIPQKRSQRQILPEPTPELVELYKKFKDERSKLGQARISGLKKIIEREREDAELEKQTIDGYMDKYVSNESTSEASLPSHSLEDGLQVGREVLRRLKDIDQRMKQLASVRGNKARHLSTGDAPLVGLHDSDSVLGIPAEETPGEFLSDAASPEELLTILRIVQYK